jgi:hypothetical protein
MRSSHRTPSYPTSNKVSELSGRCSGPGMPLRITADTASSALCGAPHKAEFERTMITDRVRAGVARVKATGETKSGRPTGRPRTDAATEQGHPRLARPGDRDAENRPEPERRTRRSWSD